MTISLNNAIEQATKFTEGATFRAGSTGWKTVMARLLEEVKRQREALSAGIPILEEAANRIEELESDPCRCHACQIAEEVNEPQGPLPAAILAGEIDDAAEKLADIAKEIDIYNGLKHEGAIRAIWTFKTFLVLFAQQLRTETIEVKFDPWRDIVGHVVRQGAGGEGIGTHHGGADQHNKISHRRSGG